MIRAPKTIQMLTECRFSSLMNRNVYRWNHEMEKHTNSSCPNRQLVVVHGLVLDRIQQIKRGVLTFGSRCSPVSYGILCDKIYDPEKHIGQAVRLDPRDKLTYAIDQIDWLVIQVCSSRLKNNLYHLLQIAGHDD